MTTSTERAQGVRKSNEVNSQMWDAGQRLKQARLQAGYFTHAQASDATARLFGEDKRVDGREISRIENGQRLQPNLAFVDRLARAYGISLAEALSWYGFDLGVSVEPTDKLPPNLSILIETLPHLPTESQDRINDMAGVWLLYENGRQNRNRR